MADLVSPGFSSPRASSKKRGAAPNGPRASSTGGAGTMSRAVEVRRRPDGADFPVKIIYEGEIYKKGTKTDSWRKRWVFVTSTFMGYSKARNNKSGKYISLIDPSLSVSFVQPPHKFKRALVMMVSTGGLVSYFSCDTQAQFMSLFSLITHPEISSGEKKGSGLFSTPIAALQRIISYSYGVPLWGTRYNLRPFLPTGEENTVPYRRPDDDAMLAPPPYSVTDWNHAWQTAWDLYLSNPDSSFHRSKLYRVIGAFYRTCKPVVVQIIKEMCLPTIQRSIQPLGNPSIFFFGNIMINICQSPDQAKTSKYAMSSECARDDEVAMRIAKNDIRGISTYLKARIDGIHVPLSILAEYKGFRVFCMALFTQNPQLSLVHGVANNRFFYDEEANRLLDEAGDRLHLRKHQVPKVFGGYSNLQGGPPGAAQGNQVQLIGSPPPSVAASSAIPNTLVQSTPNALVTSPTLPSATSPGLQQPTSGILTIDGTPPSVSPSLNSSLSLGKNVTKPPTPSTKARVMDPSQCFVVSHSTELQIHRVTNGNIYIGDGEFETGTQHEQPFVLSPAMGMSPQKARSASGPKGNVGPRAPPGMSDRFTAIRDRLYITNCARVLPSDLPRPNSLDYLVKQFRPEFMEKLSGSISSDAYTNMTGEANIASDTRMNDSIAASASFKLRKVLIPTFVQTIEHCDPPIADGGELTDLMHQCGIPLRLMNTVYSNINLPYLKPIIHQEIAARACRKVLNRLIRRMVRYFRWNGEDKIIQYGPTGIPQTIDPNVILPPAEKINRMQTQVNDSVVEFFNKAFAGTDPNTGGNEVWDELIFPQVKESFGININPRLSEYNDTGMGGTATTTTTGLTGAKNKTIPLLIPLIFSRVQSLTGIIFNDVITHDIIGNTDANVRSGGNGAPGSGYGQTGFGMSYDQPQGPFTQKMMREISTRYWHFLPLPSVRRPGFFENYRINLEEAERKDTTKDSSIEKPTALVPKRNLYNSNYLRDEPSGPKGGFTCMDTVVNRVLNLYGFTDEHIVDALIASSNNYLSFIKENKSLIIEEDEAKKKEEDEDSSISIFSKSPQITQAAPQSPPPPLISSQTLVPDIDPSKPWDTMASDIQGTQPFGSPLLTQPQQQQQQQLRPFPAVPKEHRWIFDIPLNLLKNVASRSYMKRFGIFDFKRVYNVVASKVKVEPTHLGVPLMPEQIRNIRNQRIERLLPAFINIEVLKDKKWRAIGSTLDPELEEKADNTPATSGDAPTTQGTATETKSKLQTLKDYAWYLSGAALALSRRLSTTGARAYMCYMEAVWDATGGGVDDAHVAYGEAERIYRFLFCHSGKMTINGVPIVFPLLSLSVGNLYLQHNLYPNAFDAFSNALSSLENELGGLHSIIGEVLIRCGHSIREGEKSEKLQMPAHRSAYEYYSRALAVIQATHGVNSLASSYPMFYMAECGGSNKGGIKVVTKEEDDNEDTFESMADFYIGRPSGGGKGRQGTNPNNSLHSNSTLSQQADGPSASLMAAGAPLALSKRALDIRMKKLGPYSPVTLNSMWQHAEIMYNNNIKGWNYEMEQVIQYVRDIVGRSNTPPTPTFPSTEQISHRPIITPPTADLLMNLLLRLIKLFLNNVSPIYKPVIENIRQQNKPYSNKEYIDEVVVEVVKAESISDYITGLLKSVVLKDAEAYERLGCIYQLIGGGYLRLWKEPQKEPDYYTGPPVQNQMGMGMGQGGVGVPGGYGGMGGGYTGYGSPGMGGGMGMSPMQGYGGGMSPGMGPGGGYPGAQGGAPMGGTSIAAKLGMT